MTLIVQRFAVSVHFLWFDFWVGWFWDRKQRVLYVCPLPMLVVKITMPWTRGQKATWAQ